MLQPSIRKISVTLVAALLLAVHPAPPVAAHHRPQSYCSETGDICQSVQKVDGVRKLRITLAARYFRRYVLCVRGPLRYDSCQTFHMRERASGTFGDSIRFERHFDAQRNGRYTVTWYRVPEYGPPKDRIGVRLGFHL